MPGKLFHLWMPNQPSLFCSHIPNKSTSCEAQDGVFLVPLDFQSGKWVMTVTRKAWGKIEFFFLQPLLQGISMQQHRVQSKPLHYSNVSLCSFHTLSLKQQVTWSQSSPRESPQVVVAWVKISTYYKVPCLWRRKGCSKESLCLML